MVEPLLKTSFLTRTLYLGCSGALHPENRHSKQTRAFGLGLDSLWQKEPKLISKSARPGFRVTHLDRGPLAPVTARVPGASVTLNREVFKHRGSASLPSPLCFPNTPALTSPDWTASRILSK